MATLVKRRVIDDRLRAIGTTWNAGGDAARGQRLAQAMAVVAPVGHQDLRLRQSRKDRLRSPLIADVTGSQGQGEGLALSVTDGVERGMVQAARQAGRHRVRDAAIIVMLFRHGLRTEELVALRWHQVDLKAGYLHVPRVKRGQDPTHPLRGPQLRLLRHLQRLYPDSPYVFVSERKTPLSPRSIRGIVARAGQAAGLPFVPHPHQLRHACGYYLASHGHDTRSIQAYLGHKHIQHTVRYTALAPHRFESFWHDEGRRRPKRAGDLSPNLARDPVGPRHAGVLCGKPHAFSSQPYETKRVMA